MALGRRSRDVRELSVEFVELTLGAVMSLRFARFSFVAPWCAAAAMSCAVSPVAAQNAPGSPDAIIGDEFRLNTHPQMPFAASAPDPKYQHGEPDERRRRADDGDASGDSCNLKCGN
jgi:hypothetical protein